MTVREIKRLWISAACAVTLAAGIGLTGCAPAADTMAEGCPQAPDTITGNTSAVTRGIDARESEDVFQSMDAPQFKDTSQSRNTSRSNNTPPSEKNTARRTPNSTGIDSKLPETYLDFLNGVKSAVAADWFSPDDGCSGISAAEAGKEYSLAQLVDIVAAEKYGFWQSEYDGEIEYALFDSENDGETELALRLDSVGIDGPGDSSTTTLILKEIQGNLYLCDAFDTWSRRESTQYFYGFREGGGSAGAGDHFYEAYFINGSGKKHKIYVQESVTQWWMRYVNEEAAQNFEKIYNEEYPEDLEMQIYTIGENVYYSYGIVPYRDQADGEKDKPMIDALIACYEEQGIRFQTDEEISSFIADRSRKLGIAEEWRVRKELEWHKSPASER